MKKLIKYAGELHYSDCPFILIDEGICNCKIKTKQPEGWIERFDEKFNHDNPDGVALVIFEDTCQRPAQNEIKHFIQELLDNQRKEILDKVEKQPVYNFGDPLCRWIDKDILLSEIKKLCDK